MSTDTPRVRVLPDALANQIAAGEVVERPASVVKELVENAIDAGATRVKVEVVGGGQRSLRITDDGHGMLEADARLALARHGTSKIHSADDLHTVGTLGFRGEALPSIASVSRFCLTTAVAGAEAGARLRIEGGGPIEVEVAPAARGTVIEVDDLFFNTPARRKFLKQPATELGHIGDAMIRLGLAHPHVGLKLLAEGRSVLDAPPLPDPGADPRPRLSRLLGKTIAERLLPIEDDGLERAVRVRGFLGAPPLSERGSRGQHVFVNGRFVRDKTIGGAIAEGYQGRLPKGRQPVVVLFVDLDPGEVDVNVHPQKTEVRFARSGEVYRAVQSILRRELARQGPRPSVDLESRRRVHALAGERAVVDLGADGREGGGGGGVARDRRYRGHGDRLLGALAQEGKRLGRWTSDRRGEPPSWREPASDAEPEGAAPSHLGGASGVSEAGPSDAGRATSEAGPSEAAPSDAGRVSAASEAGPSDAGRATSDAGPFHPGRAVSEAGPSDAGRATSDAGPSHPGRAPSDAGPSDAGRGSAVSEAGRPAAPARAARAGPRGPAPRLPLSGGGLAGARLLGVALGRFLVMESDRELWIADLRAVAARVEAEADCSPTLASPQRLLVPLELEARALGGRARLEDARAALAELGFEIRVSEARLTLHTVPRAAAEGDPRPFLTAALEALEDDRSPVEALQAVLQEGAAARAGVSRSFGMEEAEALLRALDDCEIRDRAPDGRPLLVALGAGQIASLFGGVG